MSKPKKPEKRIVKARVTFLEMKDAKRSRVLRFRIPRPSGAPLALMRAENIPLAFYRYLHEQVGGPHHWFLRLAMSDGELSSIVHSDDTLIDALYVDGCPAGFFELDISSLPEKVDLVYFGLCRDYVGRGLGPWFLSAAIESAWSHEPEKICVHTNNLDHPRALPLYQKLGFEPVGFGEEKVEIRE